MMKLFPPPGILTASHPGPDREVAPAPRETATPIPLRPQRVNLVELVQNLPLGSEKCA